MAGHSDLLDIPPELLEIVGYQLLDAPSALLRLRLVSRDVAARTERPMLDANFTHLPVRLGFPSSLLNAVQVAEHKTFGRHIRSVDFYEGCLKVSNLDDRSYSDGFDWTRATIEAEHAQRQLRDRLLEVADAYKVFVAAGQLQQCVKRLLRGVSRAGIPLTLAILDIGSYDWTLLPAGDELRTFHQNTPVMPLRNIRWHTQSALSLVLDQMRSTDVHVRAFKAGSGEMFAPISDLGPKLVLLQRHFAGLTSFRVALGGSDFDSPLEGVMELVSFLQDAGPALSSLELSHSGTTEEPGAPDASMEIMNSLVRAMCEQLVLPSLASLKLSTFDIEYDLLVRFLSRHGTTLAQYWLHDACVYGCAEDLSEHELAARFVAELCDAGISEQAGRLHVFWSRH